MFDRPASSWWLYLIVVSHLAMTSLRQVRSLPRRMRVARPRARLSDEWLRELDRESAKR